MSKSQRTYRILSWLLLAVSAAVITVYGLILRRAITLHNPENLSCATPMKLTNGGYAYIQFNLKDQNRYEPWFDGSYFVNLGKNGGKTGGKFKITRSAGRNFGSSISVGEFFYDQPNDALWMTKEESLSFISLSGSHRDFPFDSAHFDFTVKVEPPLPVENIIIRNYNPSFDIPCQSIRFSVVSNDTLGIAFDAKRNRLVQLTAVVLLGAGFIFLIAIVRFVKSESLATAIASYFFSMWSIRSILSSEMKIFPTILDLGILSLCVLLLAALGVRLALRELKTLRTKQEGIERL